MKKSHGSWRAALSVCLCIGLFNTTTALADPPLNVPIKVMETSGVGGDAIPTSVVVPLPLGIYADTRTFRLVDAAGSEVPAQFEILNRWAGRDGTLRHVLVHFKSILSPYAGSSASGRATYYLRDDGHGDTTLPGVVVTTTADLITVNTGALSVELNRNGNFNLFNRVMLDSAGDGFDSNDEIVSSNVRNGAHVLAATFDQNLNRLVDQDQYDASYQGINTVVEEDGPLRAVIRIEAPGGCFSSPAEREHGFAVRLYFYAGASFVKVDYQLQNSPKKSCAGQAIVSGWPLYFESLDIDLRLNLSTQKITRFGTDAAPFEVPSEIRFAELRQDSPNSFSIVNQEDNSILLARSRGAGRPRTEGQAAGWIDISDERWGVTAVTKNFAQMFPNGLASNPQNRISIELFPKWGAQWFEGQYHESGLYWIEDLQHVYKEALLFFHGPISNTATLNNMAKFFSNPPVPAVDYQQYVTTAATLDMMGRLPRRQPPTSDVRTRTYAENQYDVRREDTFYFGWQNFGVDVSRWRPCNTGGWPHDESGFIATQSVADYRIADERAIGELNGRPQWMADYNMNRDGWAGLRLGGYCGGSWRSAAMRRVAGTEYSGNVRVAMARDDQHGWWYAAEQAYYLTANPWIKDWYSFVGEFRKLTSLQDAVRPSDVTRALAHGFAHTLQAFRVTGDLDLLERTRLWFVDLLLPATSRLYGTHVYIEDYGATPADASWQIGYMMRAVLSYIHEIQDSDYQTAAQLFNYLTGLAEFIRVAGHWSFSWVMGHPELSRPGPACSSGASTVAVDPYALYYYYTGFTRHWLDLQRYLNVGYPDPDQAGYWWDGRNSRFVECDTRRTPYGGPETWDGTENDRFLGRSYQFAAESARQRKVRPTRIDDLAVSISGDTATLTWTAPPQTQAHRYHIVWSNLPIARVTTDNPSYINWWAANAVGTDLVPVPGQTQSISIPHVTRPFYARILVFGKNAVSSPSNLASAP